MKINVLISTIDDRVDQVPNVLLPPIENLTYIVTQQFTARAKRRVPEALQRADVKVVHMPGRGVTYARNHAIDVADGEIALFSDDDVIYRPEYFQAIRQAMSDFPEVALAKFKIRTPDGEPEYKMWPCEPYELKQSESSGTIQIAVRIDQVRKHGIRFDTRFGAGNARLIGGDEQIFIHDCLQAGLKARYFPIFVVEHPYLSTAKTIPKFDARRNRVAGGLDARLNGWVAMPKALGAMFRYWPDIVRSRKNPIIYFAERLHGAMYVLGTNKFVLRMGRAGGPTAPIKS